MGVGVIEWGWRSEGDIAREEERVLAFIYELEGKSIRLVSWFKMMCVGERERGNEKIKQKRCCCLLRVNLV